MDIVFILLLVSYALLMSCGQILFKLSANFGLRSEGAGVFDSYFNLYFACAIFLYMLLTVFWVWLVKFVPLNKAYPIVAVSFVATPLLAKKVLAEDLPKDLLVGSILIIIGIYLTVR